MRPEFLWGSMLPLVPIVAIQCLSFRWIQRMHERGRKLGERVVETTHEVVKELRTVRAFAMEEEEAGRYSTTSLYKTQIDERFELIFIDDGSRDDSANRLAKLAALDARVRVLRLDGHHGQSAALDAGFTTATDLADQLVERGTPFREAHAAAGAVVREAEATGCELWELEPDALAATGVAVDRELLGALTPEAAGSARLSQGGPSPERVREQLEEAAEALVELGADAVESMLAEGLVATMNRFNARRVAPPDEPTNEEGS